MRPFHALEAASLKAFYYAAESLSFTQAAQQAALTQSGISQHVAGLEEKLGTALFLRLGKRLKLTPAGVTLKEFAERYVDSVDQLMENVRKQNLVLQGIVRYAMPNACLLSPHFALLLEKRRAFPGIDLEVTVCPSHEVLRMLLAGDIHFGFSTETIHHPDVVAEEFVREEYVLASSHASDLKFKTLDELTKKNFIQYPDMELFFQAWFRATFPHKDITLAQLPIRGSISSLEGAMTMVAGGVGLGVFPFHCLEPLLKSGRVHAYTNNKKPTNIVYIIKRKNVIQPKRVEKILTAFWEMKK